MVRFNVHLSCAKMPRSLSRWLRNVTGLARIVIWLGTAEVELERQRVQAVVGRLLIAVRAIEAGLEAVRARHVGHRRPVREVRHAGVVVVERRRPIDQAVDCSVTEIICGATASNSGSEPVDACMCMKPQRS